ncbi:MAG: TolC family protein [Planctomycetota bacterium]|jgi:outer membrane protein TolC
MARRRLACPLLATLCFLLPMAGMSGGCRKFTKAAADQEVYRILDCRRPEVPQLKGTLDVDLADRLAEAQRSRRTFQLSLRDALAVAAVGSREYLDRREDVYLAALDLTGVRNDFAPNFFGSLGGGANTDRDGTTVEGRVDASVERALETGGSIIAAFAFDFLRGITTGDPLELAQSILRLDILLPLARGSGWVAREPLTQAERDTLYAMRNFARFQQEFTVDIATRYYRLLQDHQTYLNEEATYASLLQLLERQNAMGAEGAGRIPDFEVDQTRQQVLRADDQRQAAYIAFESALDRFKLDLGIPTDVEIELSESDLETLQEAGPEPSPIAADEAPGLAVRRRLDLENVRDIYQDALRDVLVAADALGPEVTLRIAPDLVGPSNRPLDLEDLDLDNLIDLDIDLPLERTAERNAYRAALIQASRARRDVERLEDQIILEVRQDLRDLDRARRSYDIQVEGVRLAERRVDSTRLLMEAGQGRVTTRDRLDAEDARLQARNRLIAALIDHAVARLSLERDVGTLLVNAEAMWVEAASPEAAGPGTDAALPVPVAPGNGDLGASGATPPESP